MIKVEPGPNLGANGGPRPTGNSFNPCGSGFNLFHVLWTPDPIIVGRIPDGLVDPFVFQPAVNRIQGDSYHGSHLPGIEVMP
jgi:hypothetical protein